MPSRALHAARARRVLHAAAALACALTTAACGGGGGGSDGPPHSVNGTMFAHANHQRDSDVNDPMASYTPNDASGQAQPIRNPVALGGHVNVANAKPAGAPDGRTSVAGDPEDWFRVWLAAGQVVRLLIAEDGATNDLDLELRTLPPGAATVASSAGTTRVEELTVPSTGEFDLVVRAAAGFSNYTLMIGQMPTAVGGPAPAFVPGQVLVRYREDARGPASFAGAASLAAGVGMRHVAGRSDGPMLFAAETASERRAALRALGVAAGGVSRSADGAESNPSMDTLRMVAALRARPEVRSADLNFIRQPLGFPGDEHYPLQWHYDQIGLPSAWDSVSANSGEVVAVLDTGVKAAHPDLSGQLVPGYDFVTSPAMANDGDGCDADPDDPGDFAAGGSSYHGTHVAGTVAARTSLQPAGNLEGVAGVAWNARVMPLRVLGVGGGTDADILAAMRYAVGLDNACGVSPAQTARILNLSLGGPGYNQTFADAVAELRAAPYHAIIVASAGNDASSAPSYPAAYPGVVSVSAVGPTKTRAPYSNFGSTIDVAAPGGDFSRDVDGDGFPDGVLSTFYDEAQGSYIYAFYQGTSMAAPHVAGVFALMLGINPNLTPVDVDNALLLGEITEDLGNPNEFGNGLIDAVKAVAKAAEGGGGASPTALLRLTPDGVHFTAGVDEVVVRAENGGNASQPLNVTGVSFASDDGAVWASVSDEADPASGLGDYRLSVDRDVVSDGIYTGTVTFQSDVNDVDVSVILQDGQHAPPEDDAGHQYVLLVDASTFETVHVTQLEPSGGLYPFDFGEVVDPGDYLIVAGSDFDGDELICDPGEACGVYPTLDAAAPVVVDADRSGITFATGFEASVGIAGAGAAPGGGWSIHVGGAPAAAR